MSIDTFKARWSRNVPGAYYVCDQCIDCDACRALAPAIFRRSEAGRYSYVARQPATPEETRLVMRAAEACPTAAIHGDGERFNWKLIPPRIAPGS